MQIFTLRFIFKYFFIYVILLSVFLPTELAITQTIVQDIPPNVQPSVVRKKAGSTIVLPCDVTPPKGDRVALILWYRDQHKEALYTFDARNSTAGRHHHTSHEPSFQSRASFHPGPPANLTIRHVRPSDAGLYQCRVDFIEAPSKTTYVQARVLAPPKSIHFEDDQGVQIEDAFAANLYENITLFCVVLGGDPRPYIWWTLNGKVVEGEQVVVSGMRTQSEIRLREISRRHHNTDIGCQGSAPNSSIILADKIILKINTPPLKVWLEGIEDPLVADRVYRMTCGVAGAYPTPLVRWSILRRDSPSPHDLSKQLRRGTSENLYWIEYKPTWNDNGAELNCSAASPIFPKERLVDSARLKVHYAPRLRIGLGQHLSPSSIKEGMDVYFQCSINTNPKVYKVAWFHGEEAIEHSSSEGILVSDDHLVIQRVTRDWTGEFTCRASNVVGDSVSNKLAITIQFAPVCAEGGLGVFEAALGEEVFLPCRVLAFPSNVSFYWTFANTVTQVERLSQDLIRSKGLESILRYRLDTPQDYGSLQCWAINVAGEQREACTVSLKPAGAPSPPSNCSVSNQTWDSLEISCFLAKTQFSPAFEEGSETFEIFEKFGNFTHRAYRRLWREPTDIQFLLTIYEQENLRMVHNETGSSGVFLIRELSPGLDYLITISRFNDRGRSSEINLEAFTLKTAENRMRDEVIKPPKREPKPLLDSSLTLVLIGGVGTLIAITLLLGVFVKRRCRRGPEVQPKERVSFSSLGDPPDLLEKEIGDFSPSTTTITHSSLGHEITTTSDERHCEVTSLVASNLDPATSQCQIQPTPSAHQIPLLISQFPPPPESFMNPTFIAFQSNPLAESGSMVQCQCIKLPPVPQVPSGRHPAEESVSRVTETNLSTIQPADL